MKGEKIKKQQFGYACGRCISCDGQTEEQLVYKGATQNVVHGLFSVNVFLQLFVVTPDEASRNSRVMYLLAR